MAIVGLYTAEDLWHKFGDLNMPKVLFLSYPSHRSANMYDIGHLESGV
jgi:dolichyl-phosphate-mannose-protein mannosyltransferase